MQTGITPGRPWKALFHPSEFVILTVLVVTIHTSGTMCYLKQHPNLSYLASQGRTDAVDRPDEANAQPKSLDRRLNLYKRILGRVKLASDQ